MLEELEKLEKLAKAGNTIAQIELAKKYRELADYWENTAAQAGKARRHKEVD